MTRRSASSRLVALVTLASVVVTSCGGKSPPAKVAAPSPISDKVLVQSKDLPDGLDMRVSEGQLGPPAFDRAKLAPANKLSEADVTALLARARPMPTDPSDAVAFALRERSAPAPRTGETIKGTFPPPASSLLPPRPSDRGKALEVLRYMPEGKVPLAPELSVTFSQPMVAVTSQTDAATVTPVKLTPQPPGAWRWIGTRTILFDPEIRFPQATTYRVDVPAGTKSANGGALAKAVSFTFETPPPKIEWGFPNSGAPQRLDVPMFLKFDQRIDPAAVLARIRVTADGKDVPVEMMSRAAIEAHKELDSVVDAAMKEHDGRWLAFRATRPFPKDAAIQIEVPPGTPSAEGPNVTKEAQQWSFRTYPPLRVQEARCGWGECRPGMSFDIMFNNPLDEDVFDESLFVPTPAIAGLKIHRGGSAVSMQGMTEARTTYKVKLGAAIQDTFGQTLGREETLTFAVGDAYPTFFGPQGLVVLDPGAKTPTLDFFTTNYEQLKVRLYRVSPTDFDSFVVYMRDAWNKDKPPRAPGTKVYDKLVALPKKKNALVESSIDLASALDKAGLGHAIAIVEPYPWKESYDPPKLISWVQSTRLGIDAYVDAGELVAYASDLATGKPAADVALEIRPFGTKATTDDKGVAKIALTGGGVKGAHYVMARRGADVAFVTDSGGWWDETGSWIKQPRDKSLAWYVVDDRKLYKPGEEVSLKGWLRLIDHGEGGDVGALAGSVSSVAFTVMDSRGNKIANGTAPVSSVGSFDTKFTLPKTPNLGHAYVQLSTKGRIKGDHHHTFQIEEFRRPEFEVTAQASQGPFLVGGAGDVTVQAKYYAGGPLPGAPVSWYLTASESSFTPPNRDDFVFGTWVPWWGRFEYDDDGGGFRYKPPRTWSLDGKTDATGAHTAHLDFLSVKPARTMSVTANASVTDVNRQTWSASSALLVHPSALYVGLKTTKPFVEKGTPFPIEVIGVDLDGKAAPGTPIELKTVRLDYEYKKGKIETLELDPQTCSVAAAASPAKCEFATKEGGTYQVTATIVDAKGRPNQTTLTFWVTGGDTPPSRDLKQERVQLIPDRKEYAHGQTAEILVQAPFFPAEAVISTRRSGIVSVQRASLTGPTTTIKVPITDALVPNVYVQVDLIGSAPRTTDQGLPDPALPRRPAYAVGQLSLPVPAKQRTLAVSVVPSVAKLAPGETAKLAVEVKDAAGNAVPNAETAVIVVDEAILSLAGYKFPDPIDTFYQHRGSDARDHYSRAYVTLAKPDLGNLAVAPSAQKAAAIGGRAAGGAVMADPAAARDESGMLAPTTTASPGASPPPAAPPPPPPQRNRAPKNEEEGRMGPKDRAVGFDGDKDGQGSTAPIAIRANFNPLAAWAPVVKTDATGRAVVEVKVPDNLTRYRIVAIAAAGDKQFGKGENALTARLPLMIRPSPPRFLNFGDTFKLPVVVQNQTDAPMRVKVATRAHNAAITDGAGREVTVPPNDRVEVLFPAAAQMAGTARFQLVGSSGSYADASELALPVWTPATTEAFATYGVIDSGATRQPVAMPASVVPQFGTLEITTASTNLQALTDAFLYLVKYPFDCAEQRASRILAIAALRDVLTAFKTKDMPSKAALEASVATDLERLSQMQNHDGGFAFWERGYPSYPYLTVHVASALAHAKAKGFTVKPHMINLVLGYLKNIEAHYPGYYPKEVRWAISAYALSTRKLLGDVDVAKGQKLYAEMGGTKGTGSLETHAWLLALFASNKTVEAERKEIVRHATNRVSETAGAANFVTSYGDGNHLLLASDRRVDGIMLDALIQEQPGLDLIPKVVTGLLAHRKAGRWLNTQENNFALLALDRYFHTYEKVTPDFVARVWLGTGYAGDHAFKGRTTESFQVSIPMPEVVKHDKQALTIQKDGAGRLYYRIGMTYAPASLKLDPADYGFVVTREYEGADNPKDVRRDAAGVWHIKAGTRVRVKLRMVNENRRYHVALVDPLPAGLEPMNPALAVTGPIPVDPAEQKARGAYWWWLGPWYEHQNLRDERVEAFASLLWQGVHSYTYVARATTPGEFVVPPPKAEEMYMPETFGRGGSDRVIVE